MIRMKEIGRDGHEDKAYDLPMNVLPFLSGAGQVPTQAALEISRTLKAKKDGENRGAVLTGQEA